MIRNAVAARDLSCLAAILALPLLAAGCVSEQAAASTTSTAADAAVTSTAALSAAQPRHATYRCGERGTLDVENLRSSVHLTDPEGDVVDLPAAPADQTSRYGQTPYALVLEGNEALYMKSGREPVTCTR